ncbi:hypothetical protein [Levilactobacillus namurensis]|uniref:Uncharacterized protein n=1 Tax=Levilactobacillus namurensis TaxID=380393 RepID=A0AAW8W8X3_9LACO|nr:hypothetical protein [Levilactobacillus namurensis]MDT7012834.1 hypothetical protein [Levilactobacillus namurensis]MDT7015360.1 hypothetical protein [Levilactobacillus namurensis]MDT7015572.1 hypothetical protein [Levilactobacillus namurensis]HJE44431.1 hypothetical protein [Levilactobacillus namurensis]
MEQPDAQVIRILSDTELVINLGSEDGINYNDKFEIYEPGEQMINPLTNEKLGAFDYVKASVEAKEIHEKFSIVKHVTKSRETVSHGGLSALSQMTKEVTRTTTHSLPVNENQILPQNIKSTQIQVGDPVRSV